MRKTKQLVLLTLYLHSIVAGEREEKSLRSMEIAALLKMSESTVRGILAAFAHDRITPREVLRLFPVLGMDGLERPLTLLLYPAGPVGRERKELVACGAIQYRPGVWLSRGPSDRLRATKLRLDANTERAILDDVTQLPIVRRAIRARQYFRVVLQRGSGSSAVIRGFHEMLGLQPLLPEYIFRKELQISELLTAATRAVFA